MKSQADKGRSLRQFEMGDMVFLKLQSYIQSSLAPHANHKLSFRFFGPFPVVQRVSAVAYKLGFLVLSSIHPVFHISQLKKDVGDQVPVTALPPNDLTLQVPQAIFQRHVINHGCRTVTQGLIRWSQSLDSLATWEDLEALQQRFPAAPAWGQPDFNGGGIVNTDATDEAVVTRAREEEIDQVGHR
jgi:hypothetical protein